MGKVKDHFIEDINKAPDDIDYWELYYFSMYEKLKEEYYEKLANDNPPPSDVKLQQGEDSTNTV
jgi:hypothetical protein